MKKRKDEEAPNLAPFYRRGRRCFVPLTADEASAAGLNTIDLLRLGLAQWYQQGGVPCYRITDDGKQAFWQQQEGRA